MPAQQTSKADLYRERYFYYFLVVAAAMTFAFGVYVAQRSVVLSQYGVVAQGEIVAIERRVNNSTSSSSQDSFHPVIEFADSQNNLQRFESDVSIEPDEVFPGEKVEVLYHREDPDNAVVNSWQGLWLWPILCLIISAALVLTAMISICGVNRKLSSL